MKLSVVIPTYRKPELLTRTLAALEPQVEQVAGGCEVVVVDDGSADETSEVLEAFSASLPLVEAGTGRNEGRAQARNRGWRAAQGASVLFLDDDIVLESGALVAHATAQERRPAVYLGDVGTAPELIDSSLFGYLDTRGIAKLAPGAKCPARYLLTQNVSIPRAALIAVEGFDEHFGAYGFEDMELAFRLEDTAGLDFFRLGGAGGQHIHHHTLGQYLEKKVLCGRETLPRIAQLHPSRVSEMRLDCLPSLGIRSGGTPAVVRPLVAALVDSRADTALRGLVSRWPDRFLRGALYRAYDLLVLTAYERGLRAQPANKAE